MSNEWSNDMTGLQQIPAIDQEKIDGMVQQYRHQLENLYRLAHIQGGMDSISEVSRTLRTPA